MFFLGKITVAPLKNKKKQKKSGFCENDQRGENQEICSQVLDLKIALPSDTPQDSDTVGLLYFSCQQSEPHFVLPSSARLVNQSSIASASI